MDLPWVYHGFTMDFHGEINGQLVVNQPSSYWDLPLMYHAYVFDIEIVQSKQRKCASTFWSSFLDEPSLLHMLGSCDPWTVFSLWKTSHDNGGDPLNFGMLHCFKIRGSLFLSWLKFSGFARRNPRPSQSSMTNSFFFFLTCWFSMAVKSDLYWFMIYRWFFPLRKVLNSQRVASFFPCERRFWFEKHGAVLYTESPWPGWKEREKYEKSASL